jgi:hypothetical protein
MNTLYVKEISWLFIQYEKLNIAYCILRNYKSMPAIDGHDIDLIIKKEDWNLNKELIKEMINKFNLKMVKKIIMPYARRFYLLKSEYDDVLENQLILDYHFDEEWLGAIFLKYEQIPKTKFKSYIVVEEYIEPLLPFITYLLSTKSINEKYFNRLVEYSHIHKEGMKKVIRIILGSNLGQLFFERIYSNDKEGIKNLAKRLRYFIFMNSLRKYPFGTAKRFCETIVKIIWYKKILGIYPP